MKQENIILLMVSFFINEMINSGISTDDEIKNYFNRANENAFKKMLHEYKRMQSLTRSKAIDVITIRGIKVEKGEVMYKQLKKQIDDKAIIDKNIRELEDRIKFKIQKQLGLHGTCFEDVKIASIGKKDDKFTRTFSQIEQLDNDRLELVGEKEIIVNFINDVYKTINNMNNQELNVFKCRYILGLTNRETAERLHYGIDRVKQINGEIRKKM